MRIKVRGRLGNHRLEFFLLIMFAVAGTGARSDAKAAGAKTAFDMREAQFRILSADGQQTIGTTRFKSLSNNSNEEINGETVYVDGERDSEYERLSAADVHAAPRLDTYRHSFFNADGSLLMVDALDASSGVASCTRYASGGAKTRTSKLKVPRDAYAGVSGLMTIVGALRQGMREIRFHEFACAPGPAIFSVVAFVPDRSERWPLYRGDLVRLDLRPDLGALSMLIAPFMPRIDAWFNPGDNWDYVGGEFDRYFRGPHVLTVRISPND
ncbi:MAG TPA: hypothetical protein VEY94_08580 [Patescibacteria group bacterium]|nr:hypothetical protein [Patescibacteria group bacterium]